ncbi:hypothetical protein [Nostoc sp.]
MIQGLQSDNENQSARPSQDSHTARDTINFQSRTRQRPRSHFVWCLPV